MLKKIIIALVLTISTIPFAVAQRVTLSPENIIALTPEWKGDRLPDGRPNVSDNLLERLKKLTITDVWEVLGRHGYHNQFENFNGLNENPWMILHPDSVMTGRVLTAQFLPARPDLDSFVQNEGKKESNPFRITNSSPINVLQNGDVFVADGYGKIINGTLIGSNLGNAIWSATKRGFIFNASIRDFEGNLGIKGYNGWFRGTDPTAISQMELTGINCPIRIGRATVFPGDVVLARRNGVIFIPSFLVKDVVTSAEFIGLKDEFQFQRINDHTYEWKNEHFVGGWTQKIQDDFINWLNHYPNLPMARKDLDPYLNKIKVVNGNKDDNE